MIACLGGYLDRNNAPDPGATTIGLGLKRLRDFLIAKEAILGASSNSYGG